jgi:hypothetical protein
MEKTLPILLVLYCTCIVAADVTVQRYDVELEILPDQGAIKSKAVITLEAQNDAFQEVVFYLNRDMQIISISAEIDVAYEFKTDEKPGIPFAEDAAPLSVKFSRAINSGEQIKLTFEYEGVIKETTNGMNMVTPSWVELGIYSVWFPLYQKITAFTYHISLKIDPAYGVTGLGQISGKDGKWEIVTDDPNYTILLFAGPKLRSICTTEDGYEICLFYSAQTDEVAKAVVSDLKSFFLNYVKWFGPTPTKRLVFVMPDRESGGGYPRGSLIVTPYRGDSMGFPGFNKNSGHEMSHLWWNKAAMSGWQTWINESFAEYSTLMNIREWYGEEAYQDYIDRYREQTKDKPPIWGLEAGSKDTYATLYLKGAVVLHDLRQKIGDERFFEFLNALLAEESLLTDRVLAILEELVSKEARDFLEECLRK